MSTLTRRSNNNKRKETEETQEVEKTEKRVKTNDSTTVEVHKKSVEKIIGQNMRIEAKLDIVLEKQKDLETRMENLEKSYKNNKNEGEIDPNYVKNYVRKIAQTLFDYSIYPSQNEYKEATENFLKEEHNEFFKKFKKNKWNIYYEGNVYQILNTQHRSVRGTFTAKVKEAIHFIFTELPPIDAKATPSEIQEWKARPEIGRSFSKLFKKVKTDQPTTYMKKIIDKVWRESKNAPKIQIAFAIGISETYLDPKNQVIQMSEHLLKPKIIKNMEKFVNKDKFSCSDEELETAEEETAEAETAEVFVPPVDYKTASEPEDEEDNEKKKNDENYGSTDDEERKVLKELKKKYKGDKNY